MSLRTTKYHPTKANDNIPVTTQSNKNIIMAALLLVGRRTLSADFFGAVGRLFHASGGKASKTKA